MLDCRTSLTLGAYASEAFRCIVNGRNVMIMDVAQVRPLDLRLSGYGPKLLQSGFFSRVLGLISTITHFSRGGAISLSGHKTVKISATPMPIDTSANR